MSIASARTGPCRSAVLNTQPKAGTGGPWSCVLSSCWYAVADHAAKQGEGAREARACLHAVHMPAHLLLPFDTCETLVEMSIQCLARGGQSPQAQGDIKKTWLQSHQAARRRHTEALVVAFTRPPATRPP